MVAAYMVDALGSVGGANAAAFPRGNQVWTICIFLAVMLAMPACLEAQTLGDALQSTYLSNPTLEAERANLRSTTELVAEAWGDWRPTLAIESAVDTGWADRTNDTGTFTDSDAAVVVEQNLFRGGETAASIRRGEQLVLYERARLAAVEQDVLFDAIEAYAGLVNDRAVLELAEENVGRLREQLDATQRRLNRGQVTRTDGAQAEAELAEAIAELNLAQSAVGSSEALYESITNQEPLTLTRPPALSSLPAGKAEALELASAGNPTIQAARYRRAAAESDIRIAEAGLLPTLDLQGELGYAEEEGRDDAASGGRAAIGLQLRVPIYQGGSDYARVRGAKQTVQQRDEEIEAAQRAVLAEVGASWHELIAARSRIDAFRTQVEAARVALDGVQKEALVGQRTTLDVLDLENDRFEAEVDLTNARRDEIVASYRLGAALGRLTADHLGLSVERYDPERYHENNRARWFGLGE